MPVQAYELFALRPRMISERHLRHLAESEESSAGPINFLSQFHL
jgi:hypothetical protein